MIPQFQEVIYALEGDEHVRVAVFDSAVDDYFLHSDFSGNIEDLTALPNGVAGSNPVSRSISHRPARVAPNR